MNLGRDERCIPRLELTESAILTPVIGVAVILWRVEVSQSTKLFTVLVSDDYLGIGTKHQTLTSFLLESVGLNIDVVPGITNLIYMRYPGTRYNHSDQMP